MLKNFGDVFAILAILVVIAILYYFPRIPRDDWLLRLALSLQFGGAIGNLLDRLTLGYVTDFISIWKFPVFNIADLSITLGVIVMILDVWIKDRNQVVEATVSGVETVSEDVVERTSEETSVE
jgi:signal peptidase II